MNASIGYKFELILNYFVTDENVRRTIKQCRDRVLMLQLQPGCKGHIIFKAQRCGRIRMIGAITIT